MSIDDLKITLETNPNPKDIAQVSDGLTLDSNDKGVPHDLIDLNLFVRKADQVVAGLTGHTCQGWLSIKLLWVREDLQGQGIGKRLVSQAEEIAKERNCSHAQVDTRSYQVPEFYEKLGYQEFARLEDYPKAHSRIYLKKEL